MKTAFTLNQAGNKDNIASVTLIAITLFALAGGLVASNDADATAPLATPGPVQRMETIVVTASRHADVRLGALVVTASRNPIRAA